MSAVLDLVLLVLVAGALLGGLLRGLRRELLNLFGLVVALAGGMVLAQPVTLLVRKWGLLEEVPWLLAFLAGFALASLAYSFFKAPLIPREIDLGERFSGAVLGAAKGLLLAAVLLYVLVGVFPQTASTIERSRHAGYVLPLVPVVDRLAVAMARLLPADFADRTRGEWEKVHELRRQWKEALETMEQGRQELRRMGIDPDLAAARLDSLRQLLPPQP